MRCSLKAAGWAPLRTQGRRYIASIDPGKLVRNLSSESGRTSVEIVLSDPLSWQQTPTSIGDEPRFRLLADQRTYNEILLGGVSPWKAVASRRLQITPVARTVSGVRYLKAVQVRARWFHTLGDVL